MIRASFVRRLAEPNEVSCLICLPLKSDGDRHRERKVYRRCELVQPSGSQSCEHFKQGV